MSRKLMVIVMATLIIGLTWMVYAPTSTPTRTRIDVSQLGPQVGERVPDFSLPDQNGQLRTLNSIMGPNGALLLFHRSASW
jgi:cytochrome oxidase Cu insertion factor (SCO1/SenC/PrrC family)